MLPHRDWFSFITRTLEAHSTDAAEDNIAKWTDEHIEYSKLGDYSEGAASFYSYKTISRPSIQSGEPGFALLDDLDEIVDYGVTFCLSDYENSAGVGSYDLWWEALHRHLTEPWDDNLVCGKYYDGEHQWGSYPMYMENPDGEIVSINVGNLPSSHTLWIESAELAAGLPGNDTQDDLFRNGVVFYINQGSYDAGFPLPNGKAYYARIALNRLRVNYLNPIVNSLSRQGMTTAGGVTLILKGLAFNQPDSELNSTTRNPLNDVTRNWLSRVEFIYFEGQQGQGNYMLSRALGEFNLDGDTRIVIPSMPTMARGTYHIRLQKKPMPIASGEVNSYAGRWRADESGLVYLWGEPFSFFVGTPEELKAFDEPHKPLGFFEWAWKFAGDVEWEYYAPIDVRSPDIFWEGRVLSVGSFTRSIDDFTGMFEVSDVSAQLASNDKKFQMNLARGHCKNQCVKISHGWANEPSSWRSAVLYSIVDDYTLSGPVFDAQLKDITQKYFRKSLPFSIITEDEFPNVHPDAIGQAMPELLGKHYLVDADVPGAIEAHCVDTTTYKYLAAAHPLTTITEVYSAGSLVNPANYVIGYDVNGRTYITFSSDQGNEKITFNCEGYSFPPWDSSNGYVENPAYILLFFLTLLLRVPLSFINMASFIDMADYFDDNDWDEAGKLAMVVSSDAQEISREILFSFGIKMWPDRYGRLKVGRFDLSDITPDFMLWAQTDLIGDAERKFNLKETINHIKIQWDYFPAASLYGNADEIDRESSIEDYEAEIEPSTTWNMPWVRDSELVAQRLEDDLRRLANGYRSVEFTVSTEFISRIDIFDKFYLQDPFGPSPSGAGEPWHLYYITSITYDFSNQTMGIIAYDLQWLLGQCFIIGRCEDLVHNYENASEWQKMFGYIGSCQTDSLPGGDPLKKICKCEE